MTATTTAGTTSSPVTSRATTRSSPTVVDRLRENPYTRDHDLKVDVEQGVVILQGKVASARSKRAAGDDAWDIPGVSDVSNQLVVVS